MTIETKEITGRTLRPWTKKINPLWWFLNDDEPVPPAWYLPGKPAWLRWPAWYLRNPLVNFADYVVGVCDRNYAVTGVAPVDVPVWADMPVPALGFKWSFIRTTIPLPFVSYTGTRVLWYAGWKHTGDLGFKFNILHSTVQVV
jgi:hypothetical protein